jgi:hypothetical protein
MKQIGSVSAAEVFRHFAGGRLMGQSSRAMGAVTAVVICVLFVGYGAAWHFGHRREFFTAAVLAALVTGISLVG